MANLPLKAPAPAVIAGPAGPAVGATVVAGPAPAAGPGFAGFTGRRTAAGIAPQVTGGPARPSGPCGAGTPTEAAAPGPAPASRTGMVRIPARAAGPCARVAAVRAAATRNEQARAQRVARPRGRRGRAGPHIRSGAARAMRAAPHVQVERLARGHRQVGPHDAPAPAAAGGGVMTAPADRDHAQAGHTRRDDDTLLAPRRCVRDRRREQGRDRPGRPPVGVTGRA